MLENVQRRFTRMIPGMRQLSYENRLRELKLPSLAYRRLRGDMIETFKIVTGKYNISNNPFRIAQDRITRGHHLKLLKSRARIEKRKNSFFSRVINPWNNLPARVVLSANVKDFEKNLDIVWCNHPLLYNFATRSQAYWELTSEAHL